MVKLFGFRITPFFLFILGLECLTLLVSIYLGALLYEDTTTIIALESIDHSIYLGLLLVIFMSILTPGFFYQTRVINKVRKSISEKVTGFIVALITMMVILFASSSALDSKTLFIAALSSACVGLAISQTGLFSRYWRFLVRSGMN
jgi:hypothetical protein